MKFWPFGMPRRLKQRLRKFEDCCVDASALFAILERGRLDDDIRERLSQMNSVIEGEMRTVLNQISSEPENLQEEWWRCVSKRANYMTLGPLREAMVVAVAKFLGESVDKESLERVLDANAFTSFFTRKHNLTRSREITLDQLGA